MTDSSSILISVVVATHNRCSLLSGLFDALEHQTLAPSAFEVVIVDDCSTDATPERIRALKASTAMQVTYVRQEENRGPARTRNEGIRRATGPIVAITDDDCQPRPQWLEQLLTSFSKETIVGVEGPLVTEVERVSAFTHQTANNVAGVFFTANIAYRRDILLEVGLFDESFFIHDEDVDLGLRVLQYGQILFNPLAVVFHPPVPIRLVPNARKIRYTLSDIRLYLKHPQRMQHPNHSVWLYTARDVVVGIIKHQVSQTSLLRTNPKRYGGYLLFNALRLFYAVQLIPAYRRQEITQRRLLGLER